MSKIGKMPIIIKENVTVSKEGQTIKASGSNGTLSYTLPEGINAILENGKITLELKDKNNNDLKPLYGLSRALIANIVTGVSEGFSKKLELAGVGYRASLSGSSLMISVGFSHPVKIDAMEGIKYTVVENVITVSGINKTLVGDAAAKIRAIRPPEPYKGKGIKYFGEKIRRKSGKAAKTVGAK